MASAQSSASTYDFDLFTIGAGSGGVAASRRAASHGAKVAICERSRYGGTCVIRGCVPKKLLVYAAQFADEFRDAAGFGWGKIHAEIDWPQLIAAKDAELDRLEGIYRRMLDNAGVTRIEGHGTIVGPHAVKVGERTYSARNILIATGGAPARPSIPGAELAITSDEALDLPERPGRVMVIGGGYIGVEFAGIFKGVGSEVIQVVRGPRLLRGFDTEMADFLGERVAKSGIELLTDTQPQRFSQKNGQIAVSLAGPGGERELRVDTVLMATGRTPATGQLGLDNVGIEVGPCGEIPVDAWSKSAAPHIYAVGDVTDVINLTPVAIAEGRALAETLFNNKPTVMDHSDVASAVFSQPPLACVGLSTQEATERYGSAGIQLFRSEFRPLKANLSGRDDRVAMKLIVRRSDDRVIGCHMVGTDAPEIMQGIAIAVKAGATKADFDATVGIHPSAAEEFVTMYTPA